MPEPGNQNFLFVTVGGPKQTQIAIRAEARRHVAKDHFKKKRLHDVKKYEARRPTKRLQAVETTTASLNPTKSAAHRELIIIPNSPKTILSAAATDPFSCFPIAMRQEDYELVNFWATDLTDTRKGVSHGGGYVPMRDLYLAQAFEHPASMYGMLFLSASLLAASRSHQGPFTKMLALKHRAKLLGMISSATRKSLCEMGGLVQAIGFQVVHDALFGNHESCRLHLIGMKSIVDILGGLSALKDEPRVQVIVIYLYLDIQVDFLPLAVLYSVPTDLGRSLQQNYLAFRSQQEELEVSSYITEFATFIHRVDRLSLSGWRCDVVQSKEEESLFQRGGRFYDLLQSRSDESTLLGAQRTSRMACLLLLCHGLLALKAPSPECDEYMSLQSGVLLTEEADRKPDLRFFLHLIIKDPHELRLRDVDCAHAAARSAQVVKRLSRESLEKVGDTLLSCLAMDRVGRKNPRLGMTDLELMRKEVLCFQPAGPRRGPRLQTSPPGEQSRFWTETHDQDRYTEQEWVTFQQKMNGLLDLSPQKPGS